VHSKVSMACKTCHNGTAAKGMPNTHVPIGSAACELCHKSTSSFGSFTMGSAGHTGLGLALSSTRCMTCHSGTYLGVAKFKDDHNGSKPLCGTCHGKSWTKIPGD
jgi:hypothetical protein